MNDMKTKNDMSPLRDLREAEKTTAVESVFKDTRPRIEYDNDAEGDGVRDYLKNLEAPMDEAPVNIKCSHCKDWFDLMPDEVMKKVQCPFCRKMVDIKDSLHPSLAMMDGQFRITVNDTRDGGHDE